MAHVIVDGAVDAPDTLGKMLGAERYQELRETKGMEHDGLILPAEIAETYYHLAQQHRSSWTFEIDVRAFSDRLLVEPLAPIFELKTYCLSLPIRYNASKRASRLTPLGSPTM